MRDSANHSIDTVRAALTATIRATCETQTEMNCMRQTSGSKASWYVEQAKWNLIKALNSLDALCIDDALSAESDKALPAAAGENAGPEEPATS